jgi:hypothetical protein
MKVNQIATEEIKNKAQKKINENQRVSESENSSKLAELGRVLMSQSQDEVDDESAAKMGLLGSELTAYGTAHGPNSPEDLVQSTGITIDDIQQLLALADEMLENEGPVRVPHNDNRTAKRSFDSDEL